MRNSSPTRTRTERLNAEARSWTFLESFQRPRALAGPTDRWAFLAGFTPRAPADDQGSSATPTRGGAADCWAFLARFPARRRRLARVGWAAVREWCGGHQSHVRAASEELLVEVREWDRVLADFGGDPSSRDWTDFRPLRTSREEDWSDWLQHLVRNDRGTGFSTTLFRRDLADVEPVAVEREHWTADGSRRGDLVIFWTPREATHVEVKVGDDSFEKTFETAQGLQDRHREVVTWRHFILLPASYRGLWLAAAASPVGRDALPVLVLTWEEVVVALRRALWRAASAPARDTPWCVWASTFCGAIEQRLLAGCGNTRVEKRGLASWLSVRSAEASPWRAFRQAA